MRAPVKKLGCQVQRRVSGYLKQNFMVKNALSVEYFKLPKEIKNLKNFKVLCAVFRFLFSDLNCIYSLMFVEFVAKPFIILRQKNKQVGNIDLGLRH